MKRTKVLRYCKWVILLFSKFTFLQHTYTVLDYEGDYSTVVDEVRVDEWYTLGLNLKLSPTELDMINKDHRSDCRHALRKMLSVWLRTGNATWSSLFHALSKMGLRSLGKDIAESQGW